VLDAVVVVLHRLATRHDDDIINNLHRLRMLRRIACDLSNEVRMGQRYAFVDKHCHTMPVAGFKT